MIEAVCYEPEGCGFGSCHWIVQFQLRYGFGCDSAFNRNEYQKSALVVRSGQCMGDVPTICEPVQHF
jgi:hypothetical protein